MMLSMDDSRFIQPQSQTEQPRPIQQQYQLPQEQGMQPQAFEGPQQPPPQVMDYSQHVNIQPQHVAIHLYYPNATQYGNPQQLADPPLCEPYVQIEDREGMGQPPHHHGDREQQADDEIDDSLPFEIFQQGETLELSEHPQQQGNPEQQFQQPAAAPEPVAADAASTTATYAESQSP